MSTTIFRKQLLDEVEHDITNYQNRGLCYHRLLITNRGLCYHRPVLSHDLLSQIMLTQTSVLIIRDIMRKPNSIDVLLYIFHKIHPQKQKRSVQPFCF